MGPEEEQGGCGIWQRSTRMVKAAPEIRGLWLQLSRTMEKLFLGSSRQVPAAGDHSPVTQALVQRDTAGLWWAQTELDQGSSPLYLLISLKWACFVQMEEQHWTELLQKPSEPPRMCGKTPEPSSVPLLSKYWEFCMKTTKETKREAPGKAGWSQREAFPLCCLALRGLLHL